MLEVPILVLDDELDAVPKTARPGDAAMDLVARTGAELSPGGGRAVIPAGIALGLPEGYCALVLPRSGLAAHHGVTCLNAPGLIDAGYRGEVGVVLVNTDPTQSYTVRRGDRIAQLMVLPVTDVAFARAAALDATERGAGGFGHTGGTAHRSP